MQAWDRYAYTNNSPVVHNDPSGHCIFGIDTAICIAAANGAVVSVGVDYYVTTQINHQEYSWQRGVVAATAGLLSGAIGAGIIAPLAEAAGIAVGTAAASTSLIPTTAVPIIQTGAELIVGATMSAESNVLLASAQRTANSELEGDQVSRQSVASDLQASWISDAFFGAAGYTLGNTMGDAISWMWPSQLQSNGVQRAIIGGMQAGALAVSNPNFLDALPEYIGVWL